MSNSISLSYEIVLDSALQAFAEALAPLSAFSFDASPEPGKVGNSVNVPVVSSMSAGNFAGNYTTNPDGTIAEVSITLSTHKFKTVHLTDTQAANYGRQRLEQFGTAAGRAVADAVFADVCSEITNTNFGSAGFTGAASTFDGDDVADLRTALATAKVPKPWSLIVDPDYFGAILKDQTISSTDVYGNSSMVQMGVIPGLYGFANIYEATSIPGNSENLVGFATGTTALALGVRYLMPQDGNTYLEARPLVDPRTGITLGMRRWYDNNTGTGYITFECVYGYETLQGALSRMVSS